MAPHAQHTSHTSRSTSGSEFVYDPNDPMNVEDRQNDPDDGIDYDEIIMATEADFRAGRGLRFKTIEAFEAWFEQLTDEILEQKTIATPQP